MRNSRSSTVKKNRRGSGEAKEAVTRIKQNTKYDLQFIKGIIGINPRSSEGDIVEAVVKMFKQKKIGELIEGKNYKIPLNKGKRQDHLFKTYRLG
jgi:hypothetical protein